MTHPSSLTAATIPVDDPERVRDHMLIENSIPVEEIVHTNTYYIHVDI